MVPEEATIVAVDGLDALAMVLIKPGGGGVDGVMVEASATGISREHAAYVLRNVADQWDPQPDGHVHGSEQDGQIAAAAARATGREGTLTALRQVWSWRPQGGSAGRSP